MPDTNTPTLDLPLKYEYDGQTYGPGNAIPVKDPVAFAQLRRAAISDTLRLRLAEEAQAAAAAQKTVMAAAAKASATPPPSEEERGAQNTADTAQAGQITALAGDKNQAGDKNTVAGADTPKE